MVEEKVVLVVEEYEVEVEVDAEEFKSLSISCGIDLFWELAAFEGRVCTEAVIVGFEVEVITGGDEDGLFTEDVIIGKA